MSRLIALLLKRWFYPVIIVVIGIAGIWLAAQSGHQVPTPPEPPPSATQTQFPGWAIPLMVLSVLVVLVGLVLLDELWDRSRFKRPESPTRRIEKLSGSLKEALDVIAGIQREVEDGRQLLAQLEKEVETKGKLASLSSQDAEAVLAQLREVVRRETGRGTRVQLSVNLLFFVGGAAATLLVGRL